MLFFWSFFLSNISEGQRMERHGMSGGFLAERGTRNLEGYPIPLQRPGGSFPPGLPPQDKNVDIYRR